MDAITPKERRFLPALAEAITEWFPELGGRALAVSEVSVTKENVPTLPLAMVAFIRGVADPPSHSPSRQFEITDTFVVEFWLEPARYKKANGSETPFWSYYDYEAVRDTLLKNLAYWETPGGERIRFRGLAIDASPLAVTLTFTFEACARWCVPPSLEGSVPIEHIGFTLCTPAACVPETCYEEDPCDPCL